MKFESLRVGMTVGFFYEDAAWSDVEVLSLPPDTPRVTCGKVRSVDRESVDVMFLWTINGSAKKGMVLPKKAIQKIYEIK